ncbi:molybdopterin molybdotransferase [Chromohalobacter marismortui]|uniref:Molybdopterin molybdenumtransferase n=1 Tax=Chromohalobacter marismortui TaxID=42055 RepID=A0A4R7NQ09_9GAMM|nr:MULTISPECIES: bifunctional molybdopterin-guanine dinucleotide biosynthesis adaptor protein MobB/molybdopterin molybdotransferase MoeA [Chromohalobacter]MCI0508738.1 bifunctional molybdopterin-guanine dinucleotide biosynthesis adaptor protein MobB/molybdopterin molybdotransferase MoeA [Chromohalobacter sp.]MCI0594617.1 bifunctional molybdopterin-guanine dinucleotide biosynthesis adaptor protein MobB/molybdopterin molybdotransferase MoeA [Chromohalobacter sp.]TDU22897.1 molybdopterin molybdotra
MTLSCFELGERMLSVDETLAALAEMAPPTVARQRIGLEAACGRVLAVDVMSPIDVPQNTNAAMDGIALAWPDEAPAGAMLVDVVADVLAGTRLTTSLAPGEAVRITTGAPLPDGADTVVMSEQLADVDNAGRMRVARPERVRRGQNVRQAGEDLARGQRALGIGTRLRPQHVGLLASLGYAEIEVFRPLRVAVFSTGDEVTAPGEALPPAGIYDTNRFSLHGLLSRLGCEVIDLGILRDDLDSMRASLSAAAREADMVVTSGGVSVGQADWVKPALTAIGELGLWRIAMRPGRPLAFGRIHRTGGVTVPFFGLPGNPVAVMVTFLQFVQPMLRRMQGERAWQPSRLTALAGEPLKSRAGRVDFHRGIYTVDEAGQLSVRTTGRQGSGILSSMVAANCLIEIGDECAAVEAGTPVTIQPFGDLT